MLESMQENIDYADFVKIEKKLKYRKCIKN